MTSEVVPLAFPASSSALPLARPAKSCAVPFAFPASSCDFPFVCPATSCASPFASYACPFESLATSSAVCFALALAVPTADLTASVADSNQRNQHHISDGRATGFAETTRVGPKEATLLRRKSNLPPVSIAFTAASESFRFAASSASLVPSTTDRDTKGEVANMRERAKGNAFRGRALSMDMFRISMGNKRAFDEVCENDPECLYSEEIE